MFCSFIPHSSQNALSSLLAKCFKETKERRKQGLGVEDRKKQNNSEEPCFSCLSLLASLSHTRTHTNTKVTCKFNTSTLTDISICLLWRLLFHLYLSLSASLSLVWRHLWGDSLIRYNKEREMAEKQKKRGLQDYLLSPLLPLPFSLLFFVFVDCTHFTTLCCFLVKSTLLSLKQMSTAPSV